MYVCIYIHTNSPTHIHNCSISSSSDPVVVLRLVEDCMSLRKSSMTMFFNFL